MSNSKRDEAILSALDEFCKHYYRINLQNRDTEAWDAFMKLDNLVRYSYKLREPKPEKKLIKVEKVCEGHIQAALANWAMNGHNHTFFINNSNTLFSWEADFLSVTAAGFVHEFEIKLSLSDYKRDALKWKHQHIGSPTRSPAYFWYATHGFDIEPPSNAGWVSVYQDPKLLYWHVEVKKEAPRLNTWKVDDHFKKHSMRIISFMVLNLMMKHYWRHEDDIDATRSTEG
jgi:hypothetical protein